MLGSLTSSRLSLTTLTPGTATPSQASDPVEEMEWASQAGDSAVDPERPSTKTLIPDTATYDHASIPIHTTQEPPQTVDTTAQPAQTGEKTRPSIFNLFKKGPPATSLEVPLEPWRMALVNIALLLAGFMVYKSIFLGFLSRTNTDRMVKVGLDQSIIGNVFSPGHNELR